jgi:hypothetical protein
MWYAILEIVIVAFCGSLLVPPVLFAASKLAPQSPALTNKERQ